MSPKHARGGMKLEPETQFSPLDDGLYACRQWYGWRILQWHKGAWWHAGLGAKWPIAAHGETGIEAWIGPLPVISKDYTKPPLGIARAPEPMEYDL